MNKETKIYIAGHRGMVGSAIWRKLSSEGYINLIGKTSKELDLRNQEAVQNFFDTEKPEVVIDAAARVGGILANSLHRYRFLMENLQIQNNLIDTAFRGGIDKFIFLGSSCIYPKLAPQPIKEAYLLTDTLEPTNEGYAIAKITGVKACQYIREKYERDYVSLMPTNLYGTNDNFDLETSHVLPAMIRKFHDAKINGGTTVELWGSGTPMREFLYVDDLADAVYFVLNHKMQDFLYNVGTGKDLTIKELATTIQGIVGYTGDVIWDSGKPDGTPRKLLNVDRLKAEGWQASVGLKEGIEKTYEWFLQNQEKFKEVKI